jgi:hypothetical protein
MIIPKLALRNLLGAGLRTWLNVVVLSLSFVLIIWLQGLYKGMGDQIKKAQIDVEYGGGQYWHESYDPYDPLTLEDARGAVPDPIQNKIDKGEATPVLIAQATIYPEGRLQTILLFSLKGSILHRQWLISPHNFWSRKMAKFLL